jgi:hypothetical protein
MCAVSSQSLWIDEGVEAMYAIQPSLHAWWHSLRAAGDSNLQVLPQLFFLWGWEKIFGASEIALRAANVPWFLVALFALRWGFRGTRYIKWMQMAAATSPFLWYYMGEARPYMFLFATTCMAAAPLFRLLLADDARNGPTFSAEVFGVLCLGMALLSATSILAVPWAFCICGAVLYLTGADTFFKMAARRWLATSATLIALSVVAAYYAWTLSIGARPAGLPFGISNIGFAFYEHVGLAGLGPGRSEVREAGVSAFLPHLWILVPSATCIGWLLIKGAHTLGHRRMCMLGLVSGPPILFAFVLAAVSQFRLVGRHITPFLPFVLLCLSVGAAGLWQQAMRRSRLFVLVTGSVLLLSALEVRFAPRHARDDYRSAVVPAKEALRNGRVVWWLANTATAQYYGLPVESMKALDLLIVLANPDQAKLAATRFPHLVVLSKDDLFDNKGATRRFLAEHGFLLSSTPKDFEIWKSSR